MATSFRWHLLIVLVAAAILSLPIAAACNAGRDTLAFLTESEERSESGEDGSSFDNVELFAEFDHSAILLSAASADRNTEELLEIEAEFLIGPGVRGPPLM